MEKIGKYEIVKELGKGGMGTVFQATDPMIERTVAIKVLKTELRNDKDLKDRFLREAKWAGVLSHPNITTIFDLGEVNNSPFIVMEYLTGGDMKTLIEEGVPLTLVDKIKIAIDVAEGLAYAHDNDIIHRDIKPENVRILDDRKVKIMDFGIARPKTSNVTQTGMVMGTPAYMSPEQITGKKVDLRTDVFSFGVMLFELLSYKKPFSGETTARLVYEITQEPPRKLRLDNVEKIYQDKLQAIISHCLQKNLTERYRNCREILVDLHEIRAMLVSGQSTEILDYKDLADESVESIVAKGRALMSENQFERARQVFNSALNKDPENQVTLMSLDELDRKTDERRQVEILLETAERDLSDNDFEKAIEGYQRVLELDPHNSEALHNLQDLQSKLKALSSRVTTTRHGKAKNKKGLIIAAVVVAILAVGVFLMKPKNETPPALPDVQPAAAMEQDQATTPAPDPEPPRAEDPEEPQEVAPQVTVSDTPEHSATPQAEPADPDAETRTALRSELNGLTTTMERAKQKARSVTGATATAEYNKGLEAENAALRLANASDIASLRDAKTKLSAAAGHFRNAASVAAEAKRQSGAELNRLAADVAQARKTVPGSADDRDGEPAWSRAESLVKRAEKHRRAGDFSKARTAFRDAGDEYDRAGVNIKRKLRSEVDQSRQKMLTARARLKPGHKQLPNHASAEALAESASQAESSGDYSRAQSVYQQAAAAFETLAATPLTDDTPAKAAPRVVDRSVEDRAAVDSFINRYVSLFESEQVDAVSTHVAWSREEKSSWTVFFEFADAVNLQVKNKRVDLQDSSAAVRLTFTLNYTNKTNSKQESRDIPIAWRLQRDGAAWRIDP